MSLRELSDQLRDRANANLAELLPGTSVRGFGVGPMLLLAALGTRDDRDSSSATARADHDLQPITHDLVERIVREATDRANVPFREEEARKVLELLRSGEFHRDLASGIVSLLVLLQIAPGRIVEEVLALPTLPADLLSAAKRDLLRTLTDVEVRGLLVDLKDGRIDDPPNFLRETLREVLNRATINAVVETLRALIASENETFRLALIVYARSQGYDIDEADLDALHAALDPANPNVELLFDRGLQYVRRRAGGPGEASEIIQRLAFLSPA